MKSLSTAESEQLEKWKRNFCKGDKSALRHIFESCFDEIFAGILLGKPDDMAGELLVLEDELLNQSTDFCKSEVPVYEYLQKRWRKAALKEQRNSLDFFDNTADKAATDFFNEEQSPLATKLPFSFTCFLRSLSPLGRLYYELRAANELKNKSGLYLVMFFLANATSFANDRMRAILQKEKAMEEPLIPNYLLSAAIQAFTADKTKASEESMSELLTAINKKKLHQQRPFKIICQRIRTEVLRAKSHFKALSEKCTLLSELESLIFLINHYLPIDDPFELWIQLNIESNHNKTLTKELNQHQLLKPEFQKMERGIRRKAVEKRIYISDHLNKEITERVQTLQRGIASKLDEAITWKTN